MAKARCPVDDELVAVVPTDQKQHPERSSMWWYVIRHPSHPAPTCPGSGKLI